MERSVFRASQWNIWDNQAADMMTGRQEIMWLTGNTLIGRLGDIILHHERYEENQDVLIVSVKHVTEQIVSEHVSLVRSFTWQFLIFMHYDWLRDILSSSSLRLRSNRSVSDSRTDGIGRRVTASSESARSCLRESSHWLFLDDCWINSTLCCWSTANERRSWLTWGKETRWHHQHPPENSQHLELFLWWPHLVLQLPHPAPQAFFFCGVLNKHKQVHTHTHCVCVCVCVCVCLSHLGFDAVIQLLSEPWTLLLHLKYTHTQKH